MQPKPGATLYAYDSEGDLADEFPPLEIGIVTKSSSRPNSLFGSNYFRVWEAEATYCRRLTLSGAECT